MRQMLIAAGCLIPAMPVGWVAANTASSPARSKEPRFPQLTLEQLNEQQRPLGEKDREDLERRARRPLQSDVAQSGLRAAHVRPARLSALAHVRANQAQRDGHPHHCSAMARPAGVSPEEEVVYNFVTDLTTKHAVSDELFDRAEKLLGEQQVVDLTAVAGTYVGVAMILAMAEVGVPADKEPPFKEAEP